MFIAWLFFFILLFLSQASYPDSREDAYLNALINLSLKEEIYREREWHVLMFYKASAIHGFKSIVDDPDFFTAPDGKYNPASELKETLRAFFRTDVKDDAHPRCKFVARYKWLKDRLGIEEDMLPEQKCEQFDAFMVNLNPRSAVLVFPTSNVNSPASMFGHSLIRIDSERESKFISNAANYSALVDKKGTDWFYAFKGIFGFYEGYFAVMPYYKKISEYSLIENRDIWEYHLALSEEEVKKMIMHLWELRFIHSYYYFFDENCSYMILFLIEAARPDVHLTDAFSYWVIPVDTIRLIKEHGLVSNVVYRPARATKIKHIARLTDTEHQDLSIQMADGLIAPDEIVLMKDIDDISKTRVLDLSSEYLQYLYAKKEIERQEYTGRFIKILDARSKLGKYEYDFPVPPQPEEGHGTSRFSVGAGIKNDMVYQNLEFRFAYHDMLDPDEGYIDGSAISFLDTEIRYDYADDEVFLQKFTILDIKSLIEGDRFFRNIAWRINSGFSREDISKQDNRTTFNINGGIGISKEILADGRIYGLIEPDLKIGGELDKNYALGGGLSAGVLKPLSKIWKMQLELRGVSYELGDKHEIYSLRLNQRLKVTPNSAFVLSVTGEKISGFDSYDSNLKWNLYF